MIAGSTPTHTFDLPFSTELISELEIAYAQKDRIILHKYYEDCTLEGNAIITKLSQEDTFKFDEKNGNVCIQIRIKSKDGNVPISDIIVVPLKQCLFDEAM